jgi:3-dehydroquinate synthase
MNVVHVALPHHRYSIMIEPGIIDRLGSIVAEHAPHPRCALVTDRTVAELHGSRAGRSLGSAGYHVAVHTIEQGEAQKNLDTVKAIYDAMLDAHLERRSPVVAVGGGVIGDMAGFVAATYLRGVPFVQCPTTLLAMVDASVGGKVGVNVPQGKNLIGAFYQPRAVVIDPRVLKTLDQRQLRCGLAECVKHAMIREPKLFDWIEQNLASLTALDEAVMVELISRNVQIKAAVVTEDEKEAGVRAHLNFGHTFAHAIESTVGYGEIQHGEAVGLGMIAATALAEATGRCSAGLADRLRALLDRVGLPTTAKLPPTQTLIEAMTLDKKVQDDRVRLVLPQKLGEVEIVDDTPADQVARAWSAVRDD